MTEPSDNISKLYTKPTKLDANRKKQEKVTTEAQAPAGRAKDSVEISGKRPGASRDGVDITPAEMKEYMEALKNAPEMRQDEIDRVEAILAEDGYKNRPDIISVVADRLMTEG